MGSRELHPQKGLKGMGVFTIAEKTPEGPSRSSDKEAYVNVAVIFKGLFFFFEWKNGIQVCVPDVGDEHSYRLGRFGEFDLKRGRTYALEGVKAGKASFKKEQNLTAKQLSPEPAPGPLLHSTLNFLKPDECHSLKRIERPDGAFGGPDKDKVDGDRIAMRQVFVYKKVPLGDALKLAPSGWKPKPEPGGKSVILVIAAAPLEPMSESEADAHSVREFNTGVRLVNGLNVQQVKAIEVDFDPVSEADELKKLADSLELGAEYLSAIVYNELPEQTDNMVAAAMKIETVTARRALEVRTCSGLIVNNN